MRELHPGHALMFKRLATETYASKTNVAVKWVRPKACGTGLEINPKTGKIDDKCIREVFDMLSQDKIPGPLRMMLYVPEKLLEMIKKGDPWVKAFAFIFASSVASLRNVRCSIVLYIFDACLPRAYNSTASRLK